MVHLLGVVSAGGVDSAPVPGWSVEQGGGLEGPEVQATVWGEGGQTRLTGRLIGNQFFFTEDSFLSDFSVK